MQSHHNLYFQGLRREEESSSSSKETAVKPKEKLRGKQRRKRRKADLQKKEKHHLCTHSLILTQATRERLTLRKILPRLSQSTNTLLQPAEKERELNTTELNHTSNHLPSWCCVTAAGLRDAAQVTTEPEVPGGLCK